MCTLSVWQELSSVIKQSNSKLNVTTYILENYNSVTKGRVLLTDALYLFGWTAASVGFARLFGWAIQCATLCLAGTFVSRKLINQYNV